MKYLKGHSYVLVCHNEDPHCERRFEFTPMKCDRYERPHNCPDCRKVVNQRSLGKLWAKIEADIGVRKEAPDAQ